MQTPDQQFFERADAHINLANSQISESVSKGKVSASFSYGAARFNVWVSACEWVSAKELADVRQETIEYFVAEYRKMLEENFEDYILNFESYMNNLDDVT